MAGSRYKKPSVDPDTWRIPPRLQARLVSPSTAGCTHPLCGSLAPAGGRSSQPLTGMVRTEVIGSDEPPRIWCGGLCATYGMALAEVRVRTSP